MKKSPQVVSGPAAVELPAKNAHCSAYWLFDQPQNPNARRLCSALNGAEAIVQLLHADCAIVADRETAVDEDLPGLPAPYGFRVADGLFQALELCLAEIGGYVGHEATRGSSRGHQ